MEVTGPAPIGGGQPLQPIQPPETVTPASDVAPADAVDRVEFSPEAQARVAAGGPGTGSGPWRVGQDGGRARRGGFSSCRLCRVPRSAAVHLATDV